MKNKLLALVSLSVAMVSFGQRQLYLGNDNFAELRYARAAEFYSEAVEAKPTLEATEKLADCYRFLNKFGRAEKYYRKAINFPGSTARNYYYLGQMLKVNEKYDEAIEVFKAYANKKGADAAKVDKLIKSCDLAKEWKAEKHNYKLTPVVAVNSTNSDFGFAWLNDSTVAYTTNRRKGEYELSKDQLKPYFRIAYTELDDSFKVVKPRYMKFDMDLEYHIATPTFTASGDTVFFTRSYIEKDRRENLNRLELNFSVKQKNGNWSKPRALPINARNSSNGHPYWDKENRKLYFISDRKGSFGGYDIYVSDFNLGNWTEPVNLGSTVNSEEDEFYPNLNNGTLYFSSKGHIGMGGLDIFKTEKVGDTYKEPENLKAPFNSSFDDFAFVQIHDEKRGWISSNRSGRNGTDDVYFFEYIEDLEPLCYLVVSPQVTIEDKIEKIGDAVVFVNSTSDLENFIVPEKRNGADYYPIDCAGDYKIKVVSEDNLTFEDVASVSSFELVEKKEISEGLPRQYEHTLKFSPELMENKIGSTYKLQNVYFDYNKWDIRDDAVNDLKGLAAVLKNNPDVRVELGSHTDNRGPAAYNKSLSKKRANSVKQFLVDLGIDAKRLDSKGYGESLPVNRCKDGVECSEAEYQANRRTEFKIVK